MQMGEGYEPDRFVDRVLHGFKCCICQCVLNEPRLCEAEEHRFCLNCISQHLPNSQTCPVCQQPLTFETLKCPGKHFKNILSELKIKCEYINRGCPKHVELGNLQNHVNNCEYRPVTCEECHLEVNAKDEDNHKKNFCQLGGANIQGLKDIKLRQKEMKRELKTSKERQKQLNERQNKMELTLNLGGEKLQGIENEQNLLRDQLIEVTNRYEESHNFSSSYKYEMRNEVEGIKRSHDEAFKDAAKTKRNVDKLKVQIRQMATKKEMTKEFVEVKQAQSEMNEKLEGMEEFPLTFFCAKNL
ncbi:E3 ubiquitin-protein ligase NRDP1-like [Dendronephthya gigantea]|uniref:E3 ubiquitin-protein ligase NRDP1-like n=1 Tax=Dendronephthya gigantea TaxID=151771 RepID=UPI00106D88B8|nr:E3 ubiquitin-protein ligase NRDP1-like [Dendronephthya gigantea]XP_028415433.1 E3 ubiquitin-protein ligase NRDP1-like [Dendronephthya gigantea]